MTSTPYLKGLNEQGGTLYVFPSVSKDLTKTFVSSEYEFKFSHFACLNLPDFYAGKYSSGLANNKPTNESANIDDCYFATDENKVYRYTSEGWKEDNTNKNGLYLKTLVPSSVTVDENILGRNLVEHLQNYVMNFEAGILNGEGDDDDYDNDILTTVSEKVFFNWLQKVGGIKFTENGGEEEYSSYADRIVQYIGNIDIMNTVEVNGDSFEELYIHIPSTVGASTKVYFRRGELTDNKNYLNKNYSFGGDVESNLVGRDGRPNIYDSNISVKPFVDNDSGVNVYKGDIGHTIDFRDSSYPDGVSDMNSKSLEDFEFNAVLIYYDILQKTSDTNVKKTATNLYGILFLDHISREGNRNFIQRYPKKRETVYGSGNSYVLKIDMKVDTIGDTNGEYEIIKDPNSAYSMSLYTQSLIQLQNCIDFFYTQKQELVNLSQRVATLENLLMGIDTIESLKKDISRLYDLYDGNMAVDTSTLLGLIDINAKKLDTIMNGGKDLKLQYDTDVLQPGQGIGMIKTKNKVVINSEDKYSINTVIDGKYDNDIEVSSSHTIKTSDPLKICNIKLRPGENFAVIYMTDDGDSTSNFNINIDESEYNWSVGQSLKLYFICEDGGSLRFDGTTGNVYGVVVKPTTNITLNISGEDVEGNDLIEIICVEDNKFIYLIK